MKTIILFSLACTFGYSPLIANNNVVDSSFVKIDKKLHKTWYLTKAYEMESGKVKDDNTLFMKGASFTFDSNNLLLIKTNGANSSKTTEASWKEIDANSISINLNGETINFEIETLTQNNLYLIGEKKDKPGVKLHFVFNSSPSETITNEISQDKTSTSVKNDKTELKTLRNTPQYVNAMRSANNLQKAKSEAQLHNLQWITVKKWNLNSIEIKENEKKAVHTNMNFILKFMKNNTFELTENSIKQQGTWQIKGEDILLTMNNITTTFQIKQINDKDLVLSKTDQEFSVSYKMN